MKRDKIIWIIQGIFSTIAIACVMLLVAGQKPIVNYSPPRAAAVSVYYFLHYAGQWLGWRQLCLAALIMWGTFRFTGDHVQAFEKAPFRAALSTLAVIWCFMIVVLRVGNIGVFPAAQRCLQMICLVWFSGNLIEFTGWLKLQSRHASGDAGRIPGWCCCGVLAVLILSCVSVIWSGKFVYPQGDDFEYGVYCYQAWTGKEGIAGVLRGACKMVAEGYRTWQGTFSSIFLMALQPGIWGEQYYHLVPLIMTGLLVTAVFLLFYTIFGKIFHSGRAEVTLIAAGVALLAVQLPVSRASAFYWYNGAVHYMGAFSFLLYYLSFFLLSITAEKRKTVFTGLACIAAVFVGGGNLVTALAGSVLTGYSALILGALKRKGDIKYISLPGTVLLASFCVNILAPGNFIRQAHSGDTGQYGVLSSILRSFTVCLDNAFGEWTDGFWILLLLLLIPVLWNCVRKTDFDFPVPGIILGGSFCLLSAMYTPELFAMGVWRIGRIQNITYIMFLILSVLNEFYMIGWLYQRHHIKWNPKINRKYSMGMFSAGILLCVLTVLAEPEKMTTSAIIAAVRSGEAQSYAAAIEENIEKIKSSEQDLIRIKEPPRKPEIFVNPEIEAWRSGAAAYYGKKKIRYFHEKEN